MQASKQCDYSRLYHNRWCDTTSFDGASQYAYAHSCSLSMSTSADIRSGLMTNCCTFSTKAQT